jgi:hypothetical protein
LRSGTVFRPQIHVRSKTDSEALESSRVSEQGAVVIVAKRWCIKYSIRDRRDLPGWCWLDLCGRCVERAFPLAVFPGD